MADAEALIVEWLTGQFPDDRVCTETPADLEAIPRTVKVARAGGFKFRRLDRPRIVLDFYAIAASPLSARYVARSWAVECSRAIELGLPHTQLGADAWCTAATVGGPMFIPDANTTVRHFTVTASLSLNATI